MNDRARTALLGAGGFAAGYFGVQALDGAIEQTLTIFDALLGGAIGGLGAVVLYDRMRPRPTSIKKEPPPG